MFERIYWLYTKLKQGAYPSAARIKRKFEIHHSTFKRDLAYFRDRLGAPVAYDRHRNGYYLTDRSFELPAYWFDSHHLLMMLGALRHLAAMSKAEPPEIRTFRRRIEGLLINQYGRDIRSAVSFAQVQWSRCDTGLLDTLIDALSNRRLLTLTYFTAHSGRTRRRTVEPYRLHHYRGTWHLIGFCHLRSQPRVFMLSRIQEVEPLDKQYTTPRFDVADFLDGTFGIFRGGPVQEVVLRFSPAIARIVLDEIWHPDQTMTDLPDGGIRLSLKVANLTEIRRHVLMYGPDVEVLAPAELRQQVIDAAEGIRKLYGAEKS